ncbi:MAG: hypothetical protein G8237_09355 [Magnetococcales bacterium]|nr:hypothetical protein [Magnetococcales bacterium]
MATLISGPNHFLRLRFATSVEEEFRLLFLLRKGNDLFHKMPDSHNIYSGDTLEVVLLHKPEQIVLELSGFDEAQACLISPDDQIMVQESLYFSHDIAPLVDPITAVSRRTHHVKSPDMTAVFTHVYNEGDMLYFWERYYGGLFGYRNLFVIDDGSTDHSIQRLHPETNIIRIPRTELCHTNMAEYCGYFQRFLLARYPWVIQTDCDEMLVSEVPLPELLATLPGGIYSPEIPLKVVHDRSRQASFDFGAHLTAQHRSYRREADGFRKPLIASVATTWTFGFHNCYEPRQTIPGLFLMHLRFVDFDRLVQRHKRWGGIQQSTHDKQGYPLIDACWKDKNDEELIAFVDQELTDALSEEPVDPPEWLSRSTL